MLRNVKSLLILLFRHPKTSRGLRSFLGLAFLSPGFQPPETNIRNEKVTVHQKRIPLVGHTQIGIHETQANFNFRFFGQNF